MGFGLAFGLYHRGELIVSYNGDAETDGNFSAIFLLAAIGSFLPALALVGMPACGLSFTKYTLRNVGQQLTCGRSQFDLELSLDATTRGWFFLICTLSNVLFCAFTVTSLIRASTIDFSL